MTLSKFLLSIKLRGFIFTFGLFLDVLMTNSTIWKRSACKNPRLKTFLRLGYIPNLVSPKSFNEKILLKKQNSNIEHLSNYADKLLVRNILSKKGYSNILNELYFKVSIDEEVELDQLPESFVMKANHGSGMIKIVHNKKDVNRNELVMLAKKWLNTKYNESVGGTDYHYDFIKPIIIFEKVLKNHDGTPILDYKFYCFNGKVEFIDVVDNSKGIPLMYIYDKEWNQLNFSLYNRYIKGNFPKPAKLNKMIAIAEDLSSEFDFVRIDLYLIDNKKIIFGEYTFFPGGGMLKFQPHKYDKTFGRMLNEKTL